MSAPLARLYATRLTVAICLLLARPSFAAISTMGDVTPDPNTTTSDDDLYVGNAAAGMMLVDTGSDVASHRSYVGRDAGATGSVIVYGDDSTWTTTHYLVVGGSGSGTLMITNGGQVSNTDAYVGLSTGSTGAATVDGTESSWTNTGFLAVGRFGNGTLNITGGGHVSDYSGYIGGSTGSVTVDGDGSTWTNYSALYVGYIGMAGGTLNISGGGTVDVGSNLYLGFYDAAIGTINLTGGTLRMHGGELLEQYGIGTLNFVSGRLEGAGTINLGAPLVQQGGTLAPGNSAGTTTIEDGYTLDDGALEIEINGLDTAGADWDMVDVNGPVDLLGANGLVDGMLDVVLGFAPSLGDESLILDNDGTDPIIGTFASGATVYAPYEASLYEFAIDYTAGDGNDIALLTEAVGLLGDYNGNGVVDAADYCIWRDTLGTTIGHYFGADGNGDGTINEDDYAVWKDHFGATGAGSGALVAESLRDSDQTASERLSHTAVPEPATVILLLIGCAAAAPFLRRVRYRLVA